MSEVPTQVLRIALDVPLRRLFDYRAPVGQPVPAGARVRVPFGRRRLVGVVMSNASESELPQERIKSLLEVIDATPVLDEGAVGLLEWASEYYHHPIGEVIACRPAQGAAHWVFSPRTWRSAGA